MPKTVSVTVTLTFPVDVPASWIKDESYASRIEEAVEINVRSTEKRVELGDVDISFDDLAPEDE